MSTTETLGTVKQVRLTLGDTDGTLFSTEVVERALTAARISVTMAAGTVQQNVLEQAVIDVAAYRTFNASPTAIQEEAATLSKEQNTTQYVDTLRDRRDAAFRAVMREFVFACVG